ncbi:MAG: hypothetical protein CMK59_12305 [Proteobacteria bacterium]|nr:hypothetical protein [Pseudomonadota bacterium]
MKKFTSNSSTYPILHRIVMIGFPVLLLSLPLLAQQPNGYDPRQDLIDAGREERSILSDLEILDRQIGAFEESQSKIEQEYEEILAKQQEAKTALRAVERVQREQMTDLKRSLHTLYYLHRRGLARIIFGSESPEELRRRSVYLSYLIERDADNMQALKETLNEKSSILNEIDGSVKELETLNEERKLKEAQLRDQRQEKEDFLKNVRSKRETALQLLAEVSRSRSSLSEGLQSNKKYSSKSGNSNSFRSKYGKLPWPTRGRLIRGFGNQTDPYTGEAIQNLGIDIEASIGTPVKAVADGTIQLSQFITAYGQTVAVMHGDYTTVYAHLSVLRVKKGDYVQQGQTIGLVGNTGLTSNNQRGVLSFEVRYNRTAQDPMNWLQ